MTDDLTLGELTVGAVELLEDNIVRGLLALNLDDTKDDATKAHAALILHSDLIFDFDVHLLNKADGDFG